jgi:hypothetical protein
LDEISTNSKEFSINFQEDRKLHVKFIQEVNLVEDCRVFIQKAHLGGQGNKENKRKIKKES